MDWWSLFRTFTILQLLLRHSVSNTEQSKADEKSRLDSQGDLFMDVVRVKTKSCDLAPPSSGEWRRPICKQTVGCDIPLNCFNYSLLSGNATTRALKVLPLELEAILENQSLNICAVVMFYATWCPYSIDFARRFNALGRSYRELPVFAVDVYENDLYKYLTAYIPVVNFYYRGKVIYRFKATESYQELLEQLTKMTNFQPTRVELNETDNEYPVPIVRTDGDTIYLVLTTCWVLFIAAVYLCTTRPVAQRLFIIARKFWRTKAD